MKPNVIDAEVIEDEFKAPVLADIKYPVKTTDIEKLLAEFKVIPNINIADDPKVVETQYSFVRAGLKRFVSARVAIEKTRKLIKAPALKYTKKVDAVAKEVTMLLADTEQRLLVEKTKIDVEIERKKNEKMREEEMRIITIQDKIQVIKNLPLDHFMSTSSQVAAAIEGMLMPKEDVYMEFLEEALAVYNVSLANMQKAWSMKKEAEQIVIDEKARAEKQKIVDREREERLAAEDAKRKELLAAEDKEREAVRLKEQAAVDALKAEQADAARIQRLAEEEFLKQKQAFEEEQKQASDEAARVQRLSEEAAAIEKKAIEDTKKAIVTKENAKKAFDETVQDMCMDRYTTNIAVIKAIQAGMIRHLKWVD